MITEKRTGRWMMSGLLAAACFLGQAVPAFAYSYGPESEAEWAGWPEFCKVRYAASGEGQTSQLASKYPPDVIQRLQSTFGECFTYLHHHCGARLQLQRAKLATNPGTRNFALESAVKEDNFALSVCPVDNFFYPEIVTHLGLTFLEAKDLAKAEQQFDRAISSHPEYAGAYVAKASLLRKKGSVDAAVAVLVKGSQSTEGQSAEVENALGLAYFQQKNFEKAREHARKAYSLGYPLPGLRDKLAKAGYRL